MLWLALSVLMPLATAQDTPEVGHIKQCTDTLGEPVDVPEAAKLRTVRIETSTSTGSGFLASDDGYIFTAAHVVGTADTVDVVMLDGATAQGTVVRRNHTADLAMVKVNVSKALPCIPVASARGKAGTDVFVIGSPVGEALSHSVSKGVISGYREDEVGAYVQTDASINPGNSGGVLLTTEGKALGVVSFKAVGTGLEGLGFAVAVETIPGALHVAYAATSDVSLSSWTTGSAASPGSSVGGMPTATMEDAPATSGPLALPKKCKDVDVEADAFSGEVLAEYKTEQVALAWSKEGSPMLTVSIYGEPMREASAAHTYGQPWKMGRDLKIELKLADGTLISYHPTAATWMTNGWFGYWTRMAGAVTPEIAQALGTSPVVAIRAHLRGTRPVNQPVEDKYTKKWLPGFACVVDAVTK